MNKPSFKYLVILAGLMLILTCAAGSMAEENFVESALKYFPMKMGRTWSWKMDPKVSGGIDRGFDEKVVRIDGNMIVTVANEYEGDRQIKVIENSYEARKDGLYATRKMITELQNNTTALVAYSEPCKVVPMWPAGEKIWTCSGTITIGQGVAQFVDELQMEGLENVSADTGEYEKCLRVRGARKMTRDNNPYNQESLKWYCPNAGLVKMEAGNKPVLLSSLNFIPGRDVGETPEPPELEEAPQATPPATVNSAASGSEPKLVEYGSLYVKSSKTLSLIKSTDSAVPVIGALGWSADGRYVAYTANLKADGSQPELMQLFVVEVARGRVVSKSEKYIYEDMESAGTGSGGGDARLEKLNETVAKEYSASLEKFGIKRTPGTVVVMDRSALGIAAGAGANPGKHIAMILSPGGSGVFTLIPEAIGGWSGKKIVTWNFGSAVTGGTQPAQEKKQPEKVAPEKKTVSTPAPKKEKPIAKPAEKPKPAAVAPQKQKGPELVPVAAPPEIEDKPTIAEPAKKDETVEPDVKQADVEAEKKEEPAAVVEAETAVSVATETVEVPIVEPEAPAIEIISGEPEKRIYSNETPEKPEAAPQPAVETGPLVSAAKQCPPWMAFVPKGSFTIGCSEGDKACDEAEFPPYKTTITKNFCIDKTEITQGQYKKAMAANPSINTSCGAHCPVENVSWEGATAFCEKVGKRLPTEAEWEYAARAGSKSQYYWGSDPANIDDYVWGQKNAGGPNPVAQKKPNKYGLYDMLGGVWEWTQDCFSNTWYKKGAPKDPVNNAPNCSYRAIRGGSRANGDRAYHRVSKRIAEPADSRTRYVGFRCVTNYPAMYKKEMLEGTFPPPGKPKTDEEKKLPTPDKNGAVSVMAPFKPIGKDESSKQCRSGMMYVPPGDYMIGCDGGKGCKSNSKPRHKATFTKGFCVDMFLISQKQYGSKSGRVNVYERDCGPDCAAGMASWSDAAAFCAGAGKRLPTEAEWEAAAGRGLFRMRTDKGGVLGSGLGLKGGATEAWEWVSDCYDEKWYSKSPESDPVNKGPACGKRTLRGGATTTNESAYLSLFSRKGAAPGTKEKTIGFRCAMSK